jgi:hypothetical protein
MSENVRKVGGYLHICILVLNNMKIGTAWYDVNMYLC